MRRAAFAHSFLYFMLDERSFCLYTGLQQTLRLLTI